MAGVPALALRISYVGELGWEIYAPAEQGLPLWDALWEAGRTLGLIAAGGGAFDSLRLEKGYRFWGNDIHTEYNPLEAGPGIRGADEERRVCRQGGARQIAGTGTDAPSVLHDARRPQLRGRGQGAHPGPATACWGYVTSANYGHSIGRGIVYGYLPDRPCRGGNNRRCPLLWRALASDGGE